MLYGDELDTSLIVKIVVLSSWKNVEAKITPLQKKIRLKLGEGGPQREYVR